MTFAEAFAAHYETELAPCEAHARLKAIPGNASGPMGLTPNAVKALPEWQAAHRELSRKMEASRRANMVFNAKWAKELKVWRRGGGRYLDRSTWPTD